MREGDTPLIDAARHGRAADVVALLADGANVNEPKTDGSGATALILACGYGHTEVVTTLIAANADVNQADINGATPLYLACQDGRTEVASTLTAANANVNQAPNNSATPLFIACQNGHTEVVTGLLGANANVNQAIDSGGADVNGAGGGPTPLDRAKELCSTGRDDAGSAAHVVLEWGAPWSRQTHKFYPPAVRTRVAALMRIAQAIKRGKAAYVADGVYVGFASPAAVADVFESCVIPHVIASDLWG